MVFDILDSVSFREIIYVDEEEPKRRLEIADDEAKYILSFSKFKME